MKWIIQPTPPQEKALEMAALLSNKQPFPLPLANILLQRNIDTYELAQTFFVPDGSHQFDPFLMKDMAEAVDRIVQAKNNKEKILLFGDYDVDGTSAVTLLSLFMSDWGFDFTYYIPDRYKEGYGVSFKGIEYAEKAGVRLIITLDCGIKAIDQVRYAQTKGIDVIVCDHHQPGPELPNALAILDPKREGCHYPFKELTGCGVGLKLIQAVTRYFMERKNPLPQPDYDPFQSYCDLVTLSIACDIVPITGENRIIAYHGLQKIRNSPLPGIQAIMAQSPEPREWDVSDLVFFIGPRINSAGRLGDARDAVEVLLGKHDSLKSMANDLQDSNDARKTLDRQTTLEALEMIRQDPDYPTKSTTVLHNPEWHKGIIGIVASRLIEQYYRPTVLFTTSEGKLVGSARSVIGFDLYAALEACEEHLLQFGGHKYAAGLSLRPEDFVRFSEKFDQIVKETITEEQQLPVLFIDQPLPFTEINDRFIRLLNRMEPFGPGNRRPVFIAKGVKVLHAVVLKDAHVRFVLQQENIMLEAVGFNLAEEWAKMPEGPLDIAFQPIFNTWNQKTRINLRIKDFRPSNEPHATF
ncbi:MAG: single-stranded-DNA-specific exonuclease RecJ [Bacteroidia bacterium]|nr:single-stranded-DNA-specific exonuclease RecJ [Bacteroidia bacterium]